MGTRTANSRCKESFKISLACARPAAYSRKNKLGKTPVQMIKNPLFYAYLKITRSQFWNLPEPDCFRPKERNGYPYDASLFKSLYELGIKQFFSFYFYLSYSPFFKKCSINIEGIKKILFEYIIARPLHYIFFQVLFNDNAEYRKSKPLLLNEAIRILYSTRYAALPGQNTLLHEAKSTDIVEAVEKYDDEIRIAALRREWQQRTQVVSDSLNTFTHSTVTSFCG